MSDTKPFHVKLTEDERRRLNEHRAGLGLRSEADVIRHWIAGPVERAVVWGAGDVAKPLQAEATEAVWHEAFAEAAETVRREEKAERDAAEVARRAASRFVRPKTPAKPAKGSSGAPGAVVGGSGGKLSGPVGLDGKPFVRGPMQKAEKKR